MIDRSRPVVVTSIPKAGTYLLGEVLRNLGCGQTWMHLSGSTRHFTRYAPGLLREGRRDPARFRVDTPLADAITLVGPGEFAVGHLPRTRAIEKLLAPCAAIFLKRDLRDCLVSRLRFDLQTGRRDRFGDAEWTRCPDPRRRLVLFLRDRGPALLDEIRGIARWRDHPEAHTVSYERLVARDLDGLLGAGRHELDDAVGRALAAETLTRSRGAGGAPDLWSPPAEAVFEALGGAVLNGQLGYGHAAAHQADACTT